jgi:hypothetical protein
LTVVSEDTLQQLLRDRRFAREREADIERLALQARTRRRRSPARPSRVVLLGNLLAARRQALP